ncbi:hypothetical protein Leryth_006080 [Lithospermum erythrorhizon]|nr:hypothetical protein Leryth_006080 [Lithospermum erythrorhizon]
MGTNLSKVEESNSNQIEQPRKTVPSHESANDQVGKTHVSDKLPHKLDEILKDAEKQIDRSSSEKMYDQLYSGIYLKQKRQKYWVDKSSRNCFMLYANDLKITWGEDRRYWHWPLLKDQESSEVSTFQAAELLAVCWLEIHGKFETFKLSPGTRYEVVFVVMIKDKALGWNIPVNLRLTLPDKTIQQHKETLMEKQRGRWIEIPVGDFVTSPHQNGSIPPAGDMEFSMYEFEGGLWKTGLVIKGVCIRPKINP